jgi:5-methylcytosine-specific restriction endonuclease McrA
MDMAISATVEYQRQKNRESYHRLKTVPDREFGVYLTPEQVKANQKRWYQENKAKATAKAKEWAEKNADRVKELNRKQEAKPETKTKRRQWERDNPEKMTAKHRRWRHNHPAKAKLVGYRRRQLQKDAPGTFTDDELRARIDFYGHRCYLCGCNWDALPSKDQTIDHIIPLSKGGTNWPANLAPACRSCNSKKGGNQYTKAASMGGS